MPVFNSMRFLPEVLPALLAEGRRRGDVEFIFVDNGSTDGSLDALAHLGDDCAVLQLPGKSIGALRNAGAREARGRLVSFIDADCLIGESYFDAAIDDLRSSGASATGCVYDLPARPGWIEAAWQALHAAGTARFVEYLNAGNLVVERDAFLSVGGFREDLPTGEDAELGQRLNASGHRIHANPAVRAIHLGNPKTLRQFYRRQVWHGVGMFGTVNMRSVDKPTAVMLLHVAATLGGLWYLVAGTPAFPARIALALGLQLVAPLLALAFRWYRQRRVAAVVPGLLLYWLYFWARLNALGVIVSGQGARYRK
jgi:glycosyltransferase involved in cell wall biosynthesis